MQEEKNISVNDHDLPPSDEATKEKIAKHLRDEKDTISEEDLQNINTDMPLPPLTDDGSTTISTTEEINDNKDDDKEDDEETDPEAPSSWEILGG